MADEDSFKRFLAIDFGLKRIGLALSDPLSIFAYPFKTLLNDKNLWNELTKIIKDQSVKKIILGYPQKENGDPGSITGEVIKFKKQLEVKFHLEIILHDERYTSLIAKENIIKSVAKKSKRRDKGLLDRNAAAVILQDYLDENDPKSLKI